MARNKFALALISLTAALAMASCTAAPVPEKTHEVPGEPAQTRNIPGMAWGNGDDVIATKLDLESAKTWKIEDLFSRASDTKKWEHNKETLVGFGLSSKGELIGALSTSMDLDPETMELTSGSRTGVVEDGSFDPFTTTQDLVPADKYRQGVFGAVDEDTAVWVETPSADAFASNWRIFTGSVKDGTVSLLAQSEDVWDTDALPLTSGEPVPVIADSRVYWATTTEGNEPRLGSNVVSKALDGSGELEILSESAVSPAKVNAGIAVLELTLDKVSVGEDDPTLPGVPTSIVIHKDGGTVESLLVKKDSAKTSDTFGPLVADGETLLAEYGSDLFIVSAAGNDLKTVSTPTGYSVIGHNVCGNYATWTYEDTEGESNGFQYFLDLDTAELRKIANTHLFGKSLCNEEYFAWSVRDSSDDEAQAYFEIMKWKSE